MRLFIEDTNEISVIEVQTVEYTKNTNEITVFDFNDNTGTITLDSVYAAESIMQKIGNAVGPVRVEGKLNWD